MAVFDLMTLYRRGDVWIRHQFDLDNSENSKNKDYLSFRAYAKITQQDAPQTLWDSGGLACEKVVLSEGSSYWALVCRGGWFQIKLLESANTHGIYEVVYDYANPGTGEFKVWFNNILTETIKGPSSWLTSLPHKAINGILMKCSQRNFGVSDPPGRAEIDNLRVYYYRSVGEIAKYSPPKASNGPTGIQTLRGYTAFQTTKFTGTENTMTIRFYNKEEHTKFQLYADRPHVLCDEKGVLYRGVIELGEVKYLGSGLYEQDINFKSPNKLGEGWS